MRAQRDRENEMCGLYICPGGVVVVVGLWSGVAKDDVRCLRGIKSAMQDPQGKLSSWDFTNTSVGVICKFVGVSCWNDREDRILSLELRDMMLGGTVPQSLEYCGNLQKLDLAGNSLAGPVPVQICAWIPFVVDLDLSGNAFDGPIPKDLSRCTYLNTLVLSGNRLSGPIPSELATLPRLKTLQLNDNRLSGQVPPGLARFARDDFTGNAGLCGRPMASCGALSKKSLAIIVAAGVFGAAASLLFGVGVWWWYHVRHGRRKRGFSGGGDWPERLRAHKLTQVSLFQKPLVKLKLSDLMAATNNFGGESVIMAARTGTTYKAELPDGSTLAIKRLSSCQLAEKQFRWEMNRLGQMRHPNLTPLLGFCCVEDEKLLVYKHLSNGTLFSLLRGPPPLDWAARLRIAVGAARGLAWLHHGCHPATVHQNVCSKAILVDEDFEVSLVLRLNFFKLYLFLFCI